MNPTLDLYAATEKVPDLPPKSKTFSDFPEDGRGPKRAETDPNNPAKPDRVRSAKSSKQMHPKTS